MSEIEGRNRDMYLSLRAAEGRLREERDEVTRRALIYLDDGLPLDEVLVALGISRATWFRRVRELRQRLRSS